MPMAGVGWGGEFSEGFVGHGHGSGPGGGERGWRMGVPWSEYCADRPAALWCCVRTDSGGSQAEAGSPVIVGGWVLL